MLIAAHRGSFGGNIVQNTIPALENALRQGADILEIDVSRSTDGVFFVFHSDMELKLLGTHEKITSMHSKVIKNYTLYNSFHFLSGERINTLDEVLEHFKNKCLLCIDRAWFNWNEILSHVKRHEMKDQIILKSTVHKKFLLPLKEMSINYMPIVCNIDEVDTVFEYGLCPKFFEIIFASDASPLVSDAFIESMHQRSANLWVNSITLDNKTVLAGKHDDNTSLLKNPSDGWGWLIAKKFDIIQTDWVLLLKQYVKQF